MEKPKTLKKIRSLSDEILKAGDEESVMAGHCLNFVALFLALGHIDFLLSLFGNLGILLQRLEGGKTKDDPLIVIPRSDIIAPN